MADSWMITSAAATASSALFVAAQAWETRRATRSARDALDAAQALAIDATRARYDLDAPSVQLLVDVPTWPPFEPSPYGEDQQQPPGRIWRFDRDAGLGVRVRTTVRATNLGDHAVLIQPRGLRDPTVTARNAPAVERVLPTGGPVEEYWFEATFTARQWSENSAAHAAGQQLPHRAHATITATNDRDAGTEDTWHLELTGHPLAPVDGLAGDWTLTPPTFGGQSTDCLAFDEQPIKDRTYWLSRLRAVQLPEPTIVVTPR